MTDSTHGVSLLAAAQHHGDGPPAGGGGGATTATTTAAMTTSTTQTVEAVKDVVFGSAAGMVGKVVEYPFDTVKVRLQASARYRGPLDCLAQSVRAEGVAGLYRGISAPLFGAAVETSSLFFSYRLAQEALRRTMYTGDDDNNKTPRPLPLSALLACGAASGAFTSMLLTPIELVKCQLQVPIDESLTPKKSVVRPATPWAVIAAVYRHGGIAGFWHGQLGTLIRETGGSAAWFGSYEAASAGFRRWNGQREGSLVSQSGRKDGPLPVWQQMAAGACAGVSYNFIFYPADTIKSRMQTEDVGEARPKGGPGVPQGSAGKQLAGGGSAGRASFRAVASLLWAEQGLRGLYRGCGITVARAAPSSALIFTVNESLRGWFG